jgi:hypothetical protein
MIKLQHFSSTSRNFLSPFKAQWLLYVPQILRSTQNSVFVCFVYISEQTATISLYSNNWLLGPKAQLLPSTAHPNSPLLARYLLHFPKLCRISSEASPEGRVGNAW